MGRKAPRRKLRGSRASNGFSKKECRKITLTLVESYRTAMREFAQQPILTVWHVHIDVEDVLAQLRSGLRPQERKRDRARLKGTDTIIGKAYSRDSLQAVGKLVTAVGGHRRIISEPPLIVPIDELGAYSPQVDSSALRSMIVGLMGKYRDTLQSDRRHLLDHFSLTDIAHKVVGVGSVGTMAWILLWNPASMTMRFSSKPSRPRNRFWLNTPAHRNHQPRRASRGRTAPHASYERYLPGLDSSTHPARRGCRFLPTATTRLEGLRRTRPDGPRQLRSVRAPLWLDARARPCPIWRSHSDRGVSRQVEPIRQRDSRLLRNLCRGTNAITPP